MYFIAFYFLSVFLNNLPVTHLNMMNCFNFNMKKEEEYQCPKPKCSKKFKSEVALRNHLEIHESKERSFPCSQCPMKFTSLDTYRVHLNNVHNNGDELA